MKASLGPTRSFTLGPSSGESNISTGRRGRSTLLGAMMYWFSLYRFANSIKILMVIITVEDIYTLSVEEEGREERYICSYDVWRVTLSTLQSVCTFIRIHT